jgi:hypothetical protein
VRIEREQRDGYATCGRDRVEHGKCPGYESRPIPVIVETVNFLYGDFNGPSSDPYDSIVANLTYSTAEHIHAVNEGDNQCVHCGGPVNLSLEPRPVYARMQYERHPDYLVELRAAERERAKREEGALSAAERSADAQEQQAAQTAAHDQQMRALLERQVAAQERANELEAMRLGLNGESHRTGSGSRSADVAPKQAARRRT